MCSRDDPAVRDDAAATPMTPVVAAVPDTALPRPRVSSSLHATHDARVLGRDASATTVLVRHDLRLHT